MAKVSPFCPAECLFEGVPVMCTVDCEHSRDIVFRNPESVKLLEYNDGPYVQAEIVGRTGNKVYIKRNNSISTVSINSPLIK